MMDSGALLLASSNEIERYYLGGFRLTGSEQCYVHRRVEQRRPAAYSCSFGDSTILSDSELRQKLVRLDDQITACLVTSAWPTFVGNDGSPYRYRRYAADFEEDSVNYQDKFVYRQQVELLIDDVGHMNLKNSKRAFSSE